MKLLPTSAVADLGISYDFKEFNPMQSEALPLILEEESNVVVSAKTASGKSALFQVLAARTLIKPVEGRKKVCYMGTHKALVEEKAEECRVLFPDAKIEVLTGDYTLSERKKKNLEKADIFLMTAEMLDSRLRNLSSEGNNWLREIESLTVDEFHLLGVPGRGDKLEAALMRFGKNVPGARILALSATMANTGAIKSWLEKATGRKTRVLVSTYRPVDLEFQVHEIPSGGYWEEERSRQEAALSLISAYPESQFLVFTGNKKWGRDFAEAAQEGPDPSCVFHNAELGIGERREVEGSFRSGETRVLVATTTVAWGVNLPAEHVIIAHQRLGMTPMPAADLQQMAGRAGRPQFHSKGFVHILCKRQNRREVESQIKEACVISSQISQDLPFHVLASVSSSDIMNLETLNSWYENTFAAFQNPVSKATLILAIKDLRDMGMILTEEEPWKTTPVGKITAALYMNVKDAAAWIKNFRRLSEDPEDADIARAIADIPTYQKDYLSKADVANLLIQDGVGGAPKWASACFEALTTEETRNMAFRHQATTLRQDIERVGAYLSIVASMTGIKCKPDRITARIRYGIGDDLVELVSLDGVGGKRARELAQAGIASAADILKAGVKGISLLFGPKLGFNIHRSAVEFTSGEKREYRPRIVGAPAAAAESVEATVEDWDSGG